MTKAKVVVISTGGTIAMRYDPVKQGIVPAVTGAELVEAVPPLKDICPIEVMEYSNIPSPHMTPKIMFTLAKRVDDILAQEDVAGVVITHGTDTLEETAYMLDLVITSNKPVCLTAAMRSSAEISPDGPKNILDAVKTAYSKDAAGKGVLIVLNEEIHTARDVTKTHSANIKTFASPFWGPIGYVDNDQVIFKRLPLGVQKLNINDLVEDVHLIKLASGVDDTIIKLLVEKGVKGIVLEGLGRGNIPPGVIPGIKLAIAKNIPVVLTTRVHGGRVLDVYGYEGGGKHLKELGVILAGEISGQKARLKLMLALAQTNDPKEIAEIFVD
ncbi:asparaginase [Desulfonispora thiosulfatigenes DSM 11270]|uniref:asparaginase n=1 Tax=Desulfonispora thiosulfatigenes DSM 11270 TaxID=656914 RepID=A0A1W1V6M6_DESTI|nr:asparaginase [Desulfonispora thiosulfatigenes]SMB89067.1 asparaginase [Desulfonispora thiosulfatigenes DSM 11270]